MSAVGQVDEAALIVGRPGQLREQIEQSVSRRRASPLPPAAGVADPPSEARVEHRHQECGGRRRPVPLIRTCRSARNCGGRAERHAQVARIRELLRRAERLGYDVGRCSVIIEGGHFVSAIPGCEHEGCGLALLPGQVITLDEIQCRVDQRIGPHIRGLLQAGRHVDSKLAQPQIVALVKTGERVRPPLRS